MTCLVLRRRRQQVGGSWLDARSEATPAGASPHTNELEVVTIDVEDQLDAKLAALTAHRSQYPVDPRIFPRHMLLEMYGKEHFVRTAKNS